jgi:hypothetical protein
VGNKERVRHYLVSIAPEAATNSQIGQATGVQPHQQVYQLTEKLMHAGLISGEKRGGEWFFWVGEADNAPAPSPTPLSGGQMTPSQFEALAGRVLSDYHGVALSPGSVRPVPKVFDFVSPDGSIIGDAKYYTRVHGKGRPPAKLATISEHVWLLENTGAAEKFLVFGNDRRVPIIWLQKYGALLSGITFYFLRDDGDLEELANPTSDAR